MSIGGTFPDLGDMWHHGYPVSPHWEGELELDSASSDFHNEGLHQCQQGSVRHGY